MKSSLTSSSDTGNPLENVRNIVLSSTDSSILGCQPHKPPVGIPWSLENMGLIIVTLPNTGWGNPGTARGWLGSRSPWGFGYKTLCKISVKILAQILVRKFFTPLIMVYLLWLNMSSGISLSMSLEVKRRPFGASLDMVLGLVLASRHFKHITASSAKALTMVSESVNMLAMRLKPLSWSHSHKAITSKDSAGSLMKLMTNLEKISRSVLWNLCIWSWVTSDEVLILR